MLSQCCKQTDHDGKAADAAAADSPVAAKPQARTFIPPIDVLERQDALVVVADLPGADDSTVDISLERGVLTIRADGPAAVPAGFEAIYREYESGNYERSFTLPEKVDIDGATAVVRNGVLTLTLPKSKEAQPRKIPVRAS
jgi:HSP20 family molecular chaperone IbpA